MTLLCFATVLRIRVALGLRSYASSVVTTREIETLRGLLVE